MKTLQTGDMASLQTIGVIGAGNTYS